MPGEKVDSGLYNENGQVGDRKIASSMYETEKPFRKRRFFGLLKPSAKKVKEGEKAAEAVGESLQKVKNWREDWKRKEEAPLADRVEELRGWELKYSLRSYTTDSDGPDLAHKLVPANSGVILAEYDISTLVRELSLKGNLDGHEVAIEMGGPEWEDSEAGSTYWQHDGYDPETGREKFKRPVCDYEFTVTVDGEKLNYPDDTEVVKYYSGAIMQLLGEKKSEAAQQEEERMARAREQIDSQDEPEARDGSEE